MNTNKKNEYYSSEDTVKVKIGEKLTWKRVVAFRILTKSVNPVEELVCVYLKCASNNRQNVHYKTFID
jgi:hypothetical protein